MKTVVTVKTVSQLKAAVLEAIATNYMDIGADSAEFSQNLDQYIRFCRSCNFPVSQRALPAASTLQLWFYEAVAKAAGAA